MRWPTKPIGELATFHGGGTPTRSDAAFYDGDIPWVTPKDMKRWQIRDSAIRLTAAGVSASPAKLLPADSVLVVVRSGVLKHSLPVAVAEIPVTVNQDMKALVSRPGVEPRYLARLIKASESVVLSWVRATTADNFPVDNLKALHIPVPPIEEQRRIADILDRAEALRAKRRETIALLDELTESIFLDMFGETEQTWDEVKVDAVVDRSKGGIRTGPFGSQLLHGEFVNEGVAVLGIDNAVKNHFVWAKKRFIRPEKYRQLQRYRVQPGDVLITIMGTCGRAAVVPDDVPLAINTKHLCCITLDRSRCLPEYLHAYFLQHPIARQYLERNAKGAIMSGLNMGIIRDMPLRLPPLALQSRFAESLSKVAVVRRAVHANWDGTQLLFDALQQRAFTGQL